MEILTVKNVSFTYPTCDTPVLRDVSFSVAEGDFAVLCGETGSGKSTLLTLLTQLAPIGKMSGEIFFGELPIQKVPCERIGFVMQRPDEQLVTDRVYAELAFGLENLGLPQSVIARRVAEMASYFGIEDWFERDVSTLSGGQKQLLNLASVMAMKPDILILDEPTSQLDPIAASDFISTLKKLNRDFSLTVLIAEHRLEELIPICDTLLIMDSGKITGCGEPRTVLSELDTSSRLLYSVPAAARIYIGLGKSGELPLTVREGRRFIEKNYRNTVDSLPNAAVEHGENKALEFKRAYFRYARELPDVLRGLDLAVYENEIFCLLGGNGSGKTTALSCAAGLRRLYSGEIRIFEKKLAAYTGQALYQNCLTLLPQDVESVFLCSSVRAELEDVGADLSSLPYDLSGLLDKHPYDLSGGERQLVALAKVLASKPRILLMDEPTKGLDASKKRELITVLRRLKADGMTVVIVTHDVEFAALCGDRCALFFRGSVASIGSPREFFSENSFYTTAASRMTRDYYDGAVTAEDVIELCCINGEREAADASDQG